MLSALIAIALMVMAIGLGTRAVWVTIAVTEKLSQSARFQATLARFDFELVRAAGRVRQPIWLARGEILAEGSGVSVSYLDGDPTGQLHLRWGQGSVSLITSNTSSVFRGLSIAEATVDQRPPAHLVVTIQTDQDYPIIVTAPFGLFPLPQP
jgi:hypothetical protein